MSVFDPLKRAGIHSLVIKDRFRRHIIKPVVRLVRGKYYYNIHLFPRVSHNDVYLISYPRSGSTWVRCMLTSIMERQAITPDLIQKTIPDVYLNRNMGIMAPQCFPSIIKSHSPYIQIPAKVIYLVRDGRDAMLSYYYYLCKISDATHPIHTIQPRDFYFRDDIWINRFQRDLGMWHEHVLGWLNGMSNWPSHQFLIIRYEDLLSSPFDGMRTILEFIGLTVDEDILSHAVLDNQKSAMQQLEAHKGAGTLNYLGATVSRWQTILSHEQHMKYWDLAGEGLRRTGYSLQADTSASGM